jgi:hypothetical protein
MFGKPGFELKAAWGVFRLIWISAADFDLKADGACWIGQDAYRPGPDLEVKKGR